MKCINAEWEIRNLGVRTIEISVEKKDLSLSENEFLQTIENYRQQYDAKYIVVKSNTKYPAVSIYLQKAGYWLIENQIELTLEREDAIKAFEEYKEIFRDVTYKLADENEIEFICAEIEKGMFTTDRIALDPYFGLEISNYRYKNWFKDAALHGAEAFISLYKQAPVGFFQTSKEGLGGAFIGEETKNLGVMPIFSGLRHFIDCNATFSRTAVSSNNIGVLQLHCMLGRKISKIKNVLVKHYNNILGGG